jgi:hypothetical protein
VAASELGVFGPGGRVRLDDLLSRGGGKDVVEDATTRGQPAGNGAVLLRFDRNDERALGQILGCWHSHVSVREPVPSEDDRHGWRDCARISGRPWVGIIVHSSDGSWVAPELRAWVTYRSDGLYLTEPVEIKEV